MRVDIKVSQVQLKNGDVIELLRDSRQHIKITLKNASAGTDHSWSSVGC
jgi:hypothetical protein